MSHVRRTAPLFEGVKAHLDGLEKTIEAFGHHDMQRMAEEVEAVLDKLAADKKVTPEAAQAVKDRMNADDLLGGITPAALMPGCSKWPE